MRQTRISQKKREIESAQFESFLRVGDQCVDDYGCGQPPEPDIWAKRDGTLIGVEITEFTRRSAKRHEAEEDGVIERASEIYRKLEAPFVDVSVMWAPHFEITKENRGKLAQRLANVVVQNVPPLGAATTLEWELLGQDLMEAINHITINRLIAFSQNFWHPARGGCVPDWDREVLQAEINRKNANLVII